MGFCVAAGANVEIDIVPSMEGLSIKPRARKAYSVNRAYGILKKTKASTDSYIDDIRGK